MGVLINRDGGDYGSDVVTPTVEEEEENNSQADTQVIQNQHELTEVSILCSFEFCLVKEAKTVMEAFIWIIKAHFASICSTS